MARIRRVRPLSAAVILCVVQMVVGITVAILMNAVSLLRNQAHYGSVSIWLPPFAEIFSSLGIYAGMGFVSGLVGAAVYNVVADRIGGIEIQLDQDSS